MGNSKQSSFNFEKVTDTRVRIVETIAEVKETEFDIETLEKTREKIALALTQLDSDYAVQKNGLLQKLADIDKTITEAEKLGVTKLKSEAEDVPKNP